jgi:formate dehydrogenase
MAKILCVLYDDPEDGCPTSGPRDDLPALERYPDGQTLPTPRSVDFTPGETSGFPSWRRAIIRGGRCLTTA